MPYVGKFRVFGKNGENMHVSSFKYLGYLFNDAKDYDQGIGKARDAFKKWILMKELLEKMAVFET